MVFGEVLPLPDIRSSAVEPQPPPPVAIATGEGGECASGDSGVRHRSFVSVVGMERERIGFN